MGAASATVRRIAHAKENRTGQEHKETFSAIRHVQDKKENYVNDILPVPSTPDRGQREKCGIFMSYAFSEILNLHESRKSSILGPESSYLGTIESHFFICSLLVVIRYAVVCAAVLGPLVIRPLSLQAQFVSVVSTRERHY